MTPARLAMSLLEVIIALVLFSTVMIAVIQSSISVSAYADLDNTRSEITNASLHLQSQLVNDIGNSGWLYEFDPLLDQPAEDPKTALTTPLFPRVSADQSTFEFLKLRSSLLIADKPSDERYAYMNFISGDTVPISFSRYVDATPTPFMILNENYDADPRWFVAPVWESNRKGLNFDQNQDPTLLRHYLYTLEDDGQGSKNLVRKYLNGYAGSEPPEVSKWNLDETLITNVESIKFETWLVPGSTLNQNQVRIQIGLKRQVRSEGSVPVTRNIDLTASMRSINQDN